MESVFEPGHAGQSKSLIGEIHLARSEPVSLLQLILQADAAEASIEELGERGIVEFRDLNVGKTAFQRTYAQKLRYLDEQARVVQYIHERIAAEKDALDEEYGGFPVGEEIFPRAVADVSVQATDAVEGEQDGGRRGPLSKLAVAGMSDDELSLHLEETEQDLRTAHSSALALARKLTAAKEHAEVLRVVRSFVDGTGRYSAAAAAGASLAAAVAAAESGKAPEEQSLLGGNAGEETDEDDVGAAGPDPEAAWRLSAPSEQTTSFGYVSGVVDSAKRHAFERVLFRATRGNVFVHIDDQGGLGNDDGDDRCVFVAVFASERVRAKLGRIADSFGASRYETGRSLGDRMQLLDDAQSRIHDLERTHAETRSALLRLLHRVSCEVQALEWRVERRKAVFHALNCCNADITRGCLVAEVWCPDIFRVEVHTALRAATKRAGSNVPAIVHVLSTNHTPPTYFVQSKYTAPFQGIVDAYGTPRYREFNPTVFSIVTFPFLFAVMFGDVGHGFMMTMFAAFLVLRERRWERGGAPSQLESAFEARYLLLAMGVFSMFTGLIYNETFAVPIDIFGTKWHYPPGNHSIGAKESGEAYWFGVDPGWALAENKLSFLNSLKMKMSIILGIVHMLLGIACKLSNLVYFRNARDILCEVIPEFFILMSLFGYLVFLIVLKWSTDFTGKVAPSLMDTLIKMFMSPGTVKAEEQLYAGQGAIQVVLILLLVVCVPWLLLPKPFLIKRAHERGFSELEKSNIEESNVKAGEDDDGHGGEFQFGEIMIHQVVHTIEYVLGTVSNTASYLRLWALSLAHAELSEVFWERVLILCASVSHGSAGFVFMVVGFAVWFGLTVGVLMGMESLSASLHALRLHWVEYQNKFYAGDGYAFQPLQLAREPVL